MDYRYCAPVYFIGRKPKFLIILEIFDPTGDQIYTNLSENLIRSAQVPPKHICEVWRISMERIWRESTEEIGLYRAETKIFQKFTSFRPLGGSNLNGFLWKSNQVCPSTPKTHMWRLKNIYGMDLTLLCGNQKISRIL